MGFLEGFFFEVLIERRLNILVVCTVVLLTTFLQKHHYILLFKIWKMAWKFWQIISRILIRIWVILHEMSHIFFAFVSWQEIKDVQFFSPKWWKVKILNKDYISAIGYFKGNPIFFIIWLIFNRIWVFLTSIWPMILGIFISLLLINYSFGMPLFSINYDLSQYQFSELSLLNIFILLIFWIFMFQWFILSWQDISNFVFYRWFSILESLFGSLINFVIFMIFVVLSSYFYLYFLFFWIVYIASFLMVLLMFFVLYLWKQFKISWLLKK